MQLSRTYRHLGRYQQILGVLIRHGFAEALRRIEIERYLEIGLKVFRTKPARESRTPAESLRRALEELGPAFIKLGQLLSTRPDLIPLDFVREFEKLQTQARPFPGEQAVAIVERELGDSIDRLFRFFDLEPLATASLGQVHAAELEDGRRVVVKVQRPGVRSTVATDLEILDHLARLAEGRSAEIEFQRPREVVSEFARMVEKELNYTFEAAHLRRFARMFEGDKWIRVPRVYKELSTARVLTMERFEGRRASEVGALRLAGHNLEKIARRGAVALLEQIFVHGIFHADPHPGNVLILPDGVIGFIDLGQVGRIDRALRYRIASLLVAFTKFDEEAAVDALLAMTTGDPDQPPDRRLLESELTELLDWHLDAAMGEIQLGRILYQTVDILSRCRRRIPPETFLVLKALATVEGIARALSPGFQLADCARPVIRELASERLSPAYWLKEGKEAAGDWLDLARQIPKGAVEVLKLVERGKLHVEFEHKGLEPLLGKLEQVSNRLVFAIVVAALLVSSSLVALGGFRPVWYGIPLLGLVGYVLAGIMGLVVLVAILRRRRM